MNVYHLTGPEPLYTNSFVVVSAQGSAAIVDPACPLEEYRVLLTKTGAELKLVLCTHGHFDHVGTAEALQQQYGAKLYCGKADCHREAYQ